MREFEYLFDKGLKLGLRKHHKNPRNEQALVEAKNVRIGPVGLEGYANVTSPWDADVVWPFPQLLEGDTHSYLAIRSEDLQAVRVYEIEADDSLTWLVDVDDQTFGTGGGRFSMASVNDYVLMVNGAAVLRRDPTTGVLNADQGDSTIPLLGTVCDFKGQLVGGNVKSTWYDCDESFVVWADIGSESFVPTRSNEAGYRRLQRGGPVHRVLRLGDRVMVYGGREIGSLTPVTEPAPTFKYEQLLTMGIVAEGAVAGNEHQHLFIDQAGWCWRLSKDMKLERLGYQEFMTALTADEIVISLDEFEQDFYISDSSRCFLLSPFGLSEIHQRVLGVGEINGVFVGLASSSYDIEWRLVTDTIDFGFRPLKTVGVLELGVSGGGTLQTAIDTRTFRKKDFTRSQWTEVNDQGVSWQTVAGDDFRFCVRGSDRSSLSLDYFKVRWKMTDVRSIRSVYRPPEGATS